MYKLPDFSYDRWRWNPFQVFPIFKIILYRFWYYMGMCCSKACYTFVRHERATL